MSSVNKPHASSTSDIQKSISRINKEMGKISLIIGGSSTKEDCSKSGISGGADSDFKVENGILETTNEFTVSGGADMEVSGGKKKPKSKGSKETKGKPAKSGKKKSSKKN